jgi:two-component system alkaline phosphatase synthesis response regulator PhoP
MLGRVLLVDDALHILRAAEFKLKRQGFDVVCATDGEEAWEMIQEQRPDIIVTDMQMPRLNGLELIIRLRKTERFADLPVIMLTAKGFELSADEMTKQLGILDIITKPFSPRDLCKRLQAALDQVRQQQALATDVSEQTL